MRIVFPSYDFRFPRLLVSLLGICFVSSCVIVLDPLSLFWAKKWSPDFGGIFQTCSRIAQSRKNGTCNRLGFEEANAAKLCEVRALGLLFICSASKTSRAGYARSSIEKEEKGASKGATPKAGAEDTGAAQVWTPRKKKPKVSPTKDEATTRAGPFSAFGETYLTQKVMEQAKTAHAAKKDKDKGKSGNGKSGKVSKKETGNGKTPSTKEWMKTQPCYYHASGKCQRGAKCPWKH